MSRLNKPKDYDDVRTHEGVRAWPHANAEQQLRRSVMSCLLWEDEFYEDGESIGKRIDEFAARVSPQMLADIAVEARSRHNLRHVPLKLLATLARTGKGSALVGDTIAKTIQRADELSEFVAIYAKANNVAPGAVKKKLSAQVKRGLAMAFTKFDEYQLAKYDRANAVRLRDVLFLCHAKPNGLAPRGRLPGLSKEEHEALFKRLVANELTVPDTWEVALSGGADKKETFTRLLNEGKLGYLALLRNLRNMTDAGVDIDLIRAHILARKGGAERVLPFRFIAAARACPQLEPALDVALRTSILDMPELPGKTVVLVDVSRSMFDAKLSGKSDLRRIDAAAVLASIIPGAVRVFSFSEQLVEVPPRRGMAGVDAVLKSQDSAGTHLFDAVDEINRRVPYDRLIVISDEQATDPTRYASQMIQGTLTRMPDPKALGYMINVASARNGVGYGKWVHVDGFSESVLLWLHQYEQAELQQ